MIISAVDAVARLLSSAGARDYLGEPVTVLAHLLQAGSLAEAAGAPPALVAAPCCTTSGTCSTPREKPAAPARS